MSRYTNRLTFSASGPFVVLKAFTFNGVAFVSGHPFPGDHPGVGEPGPRQLRLLWENKRIDMAPPDYIPPAAAPVPPAGAASDPVRDVTASDVVAPPEGASEAAVGDVAPAQAAPAATDAPAFYKKAMGFGRYQIFTAAGEEVGKQSRDEAAIDAELARLLTQTEAPIQE